MRYRSLLLLGLFPLFMACDGAGGGDDDGAGGADGSTGGSSSTGGGSSTGGSTSLEYEFVDLTGKIRFANFVSDGTAGVSLDVYWGGTYATGEFMGTVPYGTITDFMVPRRAVNSIYDEDEAQFMFLREGDTEATDILGSLDEKFDDETQLTVALAAVEPLSTQPSLVVSSQLFIEHELSTPPAGFAHVYEWTRPWDQIPGGDFALVGTGDICLPDDGVVVGGNLGFPKLIPADSDDVTLFDANTECASGAPPTEGTVLEGHSYVVIGSALTYELEARTTQLLEVGVE